MQRFPTCSALALALLVGACNQPLPPPELEDQPQPPTNDAELFSLDHLARFELEISPSSWAALEEEPKVWAPARFKHEGETIDGIGVRLKGNHSFRPIDDKPSLKLKFNEYISGQRFMGLEGLTLNNMVIDNSMMREWVSYRIFRALGVPAPRTGYAEVWINGEPYGLYLNIEPYDDEFLERVYADPSGNLYESEGGSSVDGDPQLWDQDEGADKSRTDLAALAEAVTTEGDGVFYGSQAVIDTPRFLAFMAGESIVGHFDGHMGEHNYFIYHELAVDQWTFLPWSLDQTLSRRVDPFEQEAYLGVKCLHEASCLVDYVQTGREALAVVEGLELEADVQKLIELTQEAVEADPRKPYDAETVASRRATNLEWILERPAALAPAFDCLVDGQEPDEDEDGYGPCFQDCDESDASINPGAEELCDGIDNDCSGYADDVPACPCPSITSEGRTFYMCHQNITWYEARSFCSAQGHELARFDSETQQAEVWAAASEIHGGRWAFGLNDRTTENEYLWLDGSAPSYETWASGEPSHMLDWFDCGFLGGGKWYERNCIEKGAFICSEL